MKQELTALREFVYNSTEDTPPTVNIPISEMKKAIAMKRITIVGGNENWVKKLRQEFPNWKFVSASVSSTVDNMSILKAERVILFTDTLGHSNYYKFMQTIQSHHIPFSFCMALILSGTSFKSMTIYLKKIGISLQKRFLSTASIIFNLKKLLL